MPSEIHVGNLGTRFSITIQEGGSGINISGATTKDVIFRKPDDEVIVRSGVLTGDGTDGKMYYDIVSGDLNAAGHYRLQGRVALSSSTYYTNIYHFQVHCNV